MNLFEHLPPFPPSALGPAALAASALIGTAFLARAYGPRRSSAAPPHRALRLPRGVIRWSVIGGLAIGALFALGIDLQGLWSTVVAALSLVAIGFVAMWSILSHMLASILIVVFRPFAVGDRVEILGDEGILGEVTDLNPVYTTLRTGDGGILQVPNNLFFQKATKRHAPPAANPQPSAR